MHQEVPPFADSPYDTWISFSKLKANEENPPELNFLERILQDFNMPQDKLHQSWKTLSGGEKQRM